ncbi:phosphatidylglycerophosphatase A [Paenibacillus sp. WLX2291]|uniref:phosphatidylglycerophosphatase A family protein n=1 Tax=Paenibacillus sp. WLX2291 TaxID=3296934 RepID=UPI0039845812
MWKEAMMMDSNSSGKVPYRLSSLNVGQATLEWLEKRGVSIREIGELVLFLQQGYFPDLTIEECEQSVKKVLMKREVQNALLTGVQLDILAEQRQLISPLQEMIENDEGLYGVDEILAFAIVNVYGSIGFTNYGYIDKLKPGVLGRLNDKSLGPIHTFFDDIVGAIAAAASSRIAHGRRMEQELHQDTGSMELPEDDETK